MRNYPENCSLKSRLKRIFAFGRESGQSMIILTFAFMGMIAMLGLALDLGLVYTNRVGLKRAIDAAALAAAPELPVEEEAVLRAISFLASNGYEEANFYVAGCIRDVNDEEGQGTNVLINPPLYQDLYNDLMADGVAPVTETLTISPDLFYLYSGDGAPEQPNFFIDTRSFQVREFLEDGSSSNQSPQCGKDDPDDLVSVNDTKNFGSSSKIRIYGQVPVAMNFMQFFGFDEVVVADEAIAQNAANLDVVVVMDVTGSMMFDTICFGCWQRCDAISECPDSDKYLDYPRNGRAYPLDYETVKDPYICGNGGNCSTDPPTPGDPKPQTGNDYIILEAELYSNNSSVWDPAFRGADQGYWALQRRGSGVTSVDGRAAFVRHHPFLQKSDSGQPFGHRYTLAEAQSGEAPRLEYDFMPNWTGSTFIYVKVMSFQEGRNDNPDDAFYWSVDGVTQGTVGVIQENSGGTHPWSDREAINNNWYWLKLNVSDSLAGISAGNLYTFKVWAGSPGYAFDRIIIGGPNRDIEATIDGLKGALATPGTAQRVAASKCNPIYGLSVVAQDCGPHYTLQSASVNNLNDPLFGDFQPIRGSKEAVKAFVERLDPAFDQAGFVTFDPTAIQESQLECVLGSRDREEYSQVNNYPLNASIMGEFDETVCHDEDLAAPGTMPIGYQNVYIGIENATHGGNTDIADGLRRGLHMMGVTTDDDGAQNNDCNWTLSGGTWRIGGQTQPATGINSHCSRGQAATAVIVLLTDGAPTDGSPGDNDECRDWSGSPYEGFPDTDDKFTCIMYYAEIAGNNGIIVYTIGLGAGADPDLLRAVADETNGQYYYAPSSAQLNIIFNQILANIYIRLVK